MIGKIIKYVGVPLAVGVLGIGSFLYLTDDEKDDIEQEEIEEYKKSRQQTLEYFLRILRQQRWAQSAITFYCSYLKKNNLLSSDKKEILKGKVTYKQHRDNKHG